VNDPNSVVAQKKATSDVDIIRPKATSATPHSGHRLAQDELKTSRTKQEIVKSLIEDEAKRKRLAGEGRRYCMEKFALNAVSESADEFYEKIVTGRKPTR